MKVYVNTRMLKHLYDKRPAQEYDFILRNINVIIKYPDDIYLNRDSKRGDFCFVKIFNEQKYFCSIEILKDETSEEERLFIATCFNVKDKYLQNYQLKWSWKDGTPSS